MKYAIKTTPIAFKNADFGLPEFIDYLIASDEQFNSDGEGIRSAHRILKVLAESRDLSYLPLEDNDHARIKKASEKPTKGYPTPTAVMCYDVVQAVAEAKEERPESVEKPAEAEPATN